MLHFASRRFWSAYRRLPADIRRTASKNYRLMVREPRHPSLQLKKVGVFWSARVSNGYRALAIESGGDFVWIWIGSHGEYERLIKA